MSRGDPSTVVAVPPPTGARTKTFARWVQAPTTVWHPDVRKVGEMAPLGRQKIVEISGNPAVRHWD
jgi:hypothetical protein